MQQSNSSGAQAISVRAAARQPVTPSMLPAPTRRCRQLHSPSRLARHSCTAASAHEAASHVPSRFTPRATPARPGPAPRPAPPAPLCRTVVPRECGYTMSRAFHSHCLLQGRQSCCPDHTRTRKDTKRMSAAAGLCSRAPPERQQGPGGYRRSRAPRRPPPPARPRGPLCMPSARTPPQPAAPAWPQAPTGPGPRGAATPAGRHTCSLQPAVPALPHWYTVPSEKQPASC